MTTHHFVRSLVAAALLAAAGMPVAAQRPVQQSIGNVDWLVDDDVRSAVRRGHQWLAKHQHPDGYWSQDIGFKLNTDYRVTTTDSPHVGVTALALMSFLAGGHQPGRGEHGELLNRGLDFVLRCVGENGYVSDHGTRMYSHAFAALLLAEVYGTTRRHDVRQALQRAVNLIVDSQNGEGGWRYKPFARESDMSITVCQVLALRAARNVGITVPATTIRHAERYVELSAVPESGPSRHAYRFGGPLEDGGAFRYQLQQQSRATFPLTAAGVTTLYAAGSYNHKMIGPALEYLDEELENFNTYYGHNGHYFFYYGHYYAVQAYYISGGDRWNQYAKRMKSYLLQLQRSSGAWPCDVGPGESFGTAVATLILQIPFQYLPIFQR
jgi:hypothetical protein